MILRELGVYVLPNGRELVFSSHGNCLALFSFDSSQAIGRLQYQLNDNGRLIFEQRLTAWDITNLRDTGRTVEGVPI